MNRTILIPLTIVCLLSSAYLLGLHLDLPVVEASASIYIRTDGSIDPPTANITTLDNLTYTVTGNIHEPIVVERSNIVIDGAGHTIRGNASSAGFVIYYVSNVTIKNAEIVGFYYGLYLNSTSDISIYRNNITANSFDAIQIRDSTGTNFSWNNVTNNGNDGILLWRSANNSIISNNIVVENNDDGIVFERADGGSCSNSIVSRNNVTGNKDMGISMSYSSNISVSENDVKNNGHGIRIFNCSDSNLNRNNITANFEDGLWLLALSNSSITENNVTSNGEGIHFNRCHNNTIARNHVADNGEDGIYILSSSYNGFTRNTVTNNLCGLQLEWSQNSTFSENTIAHNGVGLNISVSPLSEHRFIHNNFINNTQQTIILSGSCTWNNSYEGNYWSNYTGVDLDNDGIGDSPHVISGTNTDNFPLMDMFSSFNTSLGFYVNVISNSTIENFSFFKSPANSTIQMYASNITSTQNIGFCRVCIPHVLMTEQYNASVDGSEPTYANYNLYDNTTHRWIFLSYNHSTIEVIIQGVDNEPPIIDLLSPINTTYSTSDIALRFNTYEPTSWIGYSLNGATNQTIQGDTELTGLPDGPHTITLYANDTVDNMATKTESFTVDTSSPTIVILSPENKTYATDSLPLNFTVNEPTSWIGYSLNGATNQTITTNITLPTLPDGSHNITIYANDTIGNMGHSSTIHFTIDTIYPTIEILSPQNKTYTTNTPQLNFTVNEPTSWIGYSLNGATNQTITTNITLPTLPDGSHNITIYANDTADNMAKSNTVHFTTDTTPPEITNVSQTPRKVNVTPEDAVKVNATITDFTSEVKTVTLNYTTNNGTWFSVEMSKLEGNIYNGTIPSFNYCTYVNYTIIAEDTAGNIVSTEDMAYELDYHVIPEFPSPIILLLLMATTSMALMITQRRKKV